MPRNRRAHGKFDFIAGNPPWINWESLPAQHFGDNTRCAEYFRKALLVEAVGPHPFQYGFLRRSELQLVVPPLKVFDQQSQQFR